MNSLIITSMTKEEKLQAVLKRLEEDKGWNLFNALTKQGEKLVADTIEAVDMVYNYERFEEALDKVKKIPLERRLILACYHLIKWGIFLTGLNTIFQKML